MLGNDFSTAESGNSIRDTTIFNCENYSFVFKQHDINLKQSKCINQNIVTTTITVENILENEIKDIVDCAGRRSCAGGNSRFCRWKILC